MMIRQTEIKDLDKVLEIYAKAKTFMHTHGNPNQWTTTPNEAMIKEDILNNVSYVLEEDGDIVGVFAFIMGSDETYNYIEGEWLNDKVYGTIHRIASSFKVKGILKKVVAFGFKQVDNIRIDTHADNYIMLNNIRKQGFKECGIIYLKDGSARIAFQKEKEKMKRCDLHVHSYYSFDIDDNSVTFEAYALKAIEEGIDVVCFTDHIEFNDNYDSYTNFPFEKRRKEFEEVKKKYQGQVELYLGYEVGEPHLHKEVVNRLRELGADMIIGSIHYPMDHEYLHHQYAKEEYEKQYSQMVIEMVSAGNFDVCGHLDYMKKYHDDYIEDTISLKKALKIAAEKGLPIELNTSSLRKGLSESMVSVEMVKYYQQCGGQYVCINSDSHIIDTLGTDYLKVKALLPEGIKLCYFKAGKLVEC